MRGFIFPVLIFLVLGYSSFATVNDLQRVKAFASNTSWAFEENKGQVTGQDSAQVKFFYKQGHLTMFLMNGRLAYQFEKLHYPAEYLKQRAGNERHRDREKYEKLCSEIRRETYRMDIELLGANPNPEIITEGKSRDYIQDYNHNALDIHSYQKIIYKNIYPNIDWVIYTIPPSRNGEGNVKYDFIVHPGGNPSDIKLKTHWVEDMNIKPDGSLTLVSRMGSITEKPPVSFQANRELKTNFLLQDSLISFRVENYNLSEDLRIDPSIIWSTYYGGSEIDNSSELEIDKSGNVFLCGSTKSSTNIAMGGHFNTYSFITIPHNGYVVKFTPQGQRLWATYYGSAYNNTGLAIDSKNSIYYACESGGKTNLSYNGFKNSFGGGVLVKFDSNGVRVWAKYYGPNNQYSNALDCAVDKNDNVYIMGENTSVDSIAFNGFQNTFNGLPTSANYDLHLVKFNSIGQRLWATYIGTSSQEFGYRLCVDNLNNVYLSGHSPGSGLFFSGFYNPGYGDFVVKFNPSGLRIWASYLPSFWGRPHMINDKDNNLYISGYTDYTLNVALNGFQNSYGGGAYDGYLMKINQSGQKLWGTYYGGTDEDRFIRPSISRDSSALYVIGATISDGLSYNGFQNSRNSNSLDVILVKFDTAGNRIWSSYFGGDSLDVGLSIKESPVGGLYITGWTNSANGLSYKGFQNTYAGSEDAFLAKIGNRPKLTILRIGRDTICRGARMTFSTDTLVYGGTNPQYTWYLNGTPIVGAGDTFVNIPALSNGDTVFCVLRSNDIDRSDDTVWSNKLAIHIIKSDTFHLYDSFCSNKTYSFNNQTISSAGLYRDTLVSQAGCDSFIFLHLSRKNISINASTYRAPCGTQSYVFEGVTRTQSGRYTVTYTNAQGCDSFVELTLALPQPSSTNLPPVTICPNQSYTFAGIPRTSTGTYTQILINSQGCDSSISLNLTVLTNPTQASYTLHECAPFTFKGKVYNNSTQVKDTMQSVQGCDSAYNTYQINLSPPPIRYADTTIEACDSIYVKGIQYQSDFSTNDTIKKVVAPYCDSIYQKFNYKIFYKPNTGLKTRDTFLRGSTVKLRPNPATHYLWSTGETQRELLIKLTEDKSITLIAWNTALCPDTNQIYLVAEDLAILGMPTGFNPNSDKLENRTLKPNINGRLEYFHMMVFNRWGEKVYETFDTNPIGWNGIFRSAPAPAGLYGYVIEYRTLGQNYTKSGEVMLVW